MYEIKKLYLFTIYFFKLFDNKKKLILVKTEKRELVILI